ncbi:ABC transporter ATP-binding protein [Maritimibacter sp. DP1N21-5]|uniref:ABC transporter ATP-binding protein n=1 Tax=Maritimibacter sp. DP1N21-5 TaxID=2836867 RepID=UPI001C46BD84|nr:ABC transporter ATP-binding protein [Maritimibacter sp. DP1N21-5]MBV7407600.1 ABC transporter ATP-binding protein [Maritimibacter sp. DP1N21-5]
MAPIISIKGLEKTYDNGFQALKAVDLDIEEGEVLALLGPNGAGKTTLISIVTGMANKTGGSVTVGGYDTVNDFRKARDLIGLVPQEMNIEVFEKVIATVRFSRGLFGKPKDDAKIEEVLKSLTLWDKRDNKLRELSGGMKRRVMIAKALSHEPRILFLDEPTAGVDVELRKEMWEVMKALKAAGVTIILTTHYIEEAEMMADRVAVISKGEILLVKEKNELMKSLGKKVLTIELDQTLSGVPPDLAAKGVELGEDGTSLVYTYDTAAPQTGITDILAGLRASGLQLSDISTSQSSLEDIFVGLVHEQREDAA